VKIIENVSKTQLSTSRIYGGCRVNGIEYKYDHKTDTLIRYNHWKEYKQINTPRKQKPKEKNQTELF
jgi:hypothetical protein